MTSSGTYSWQISNGGLVIEAFSRCRIHPSAITRHHLNEARVSLQLELQSWSVRGGPNLWEVFSGTINLVPNQIVYTLPTKMVTLTELWYTAVNANGSGQNSDRIMVPITRTQYAMIPNKSQPGTPTQFWFERLQVPQISIWEPAYAGAPQYVLNWFGLQRIQDANLGSGETPDVVYRGLEALCAGMALRLADKFLDMTLWDKLFPRIEKNAMTAWNDFVSEDQETGPLIMQPNVGQYGRMRR